MSKKPIYLIAVVDGRFKGDKYPDFKSIEECDEYIVDDRRNGLADLLVVGTIEIRMKQPGQKFWTVVGKR